ncbi:MAG: 30S ribosomal protein S6 [Candidatus Omnitrophica bacterium]|nr:30S ribosomal protein S6 [Candidatus Omnitrophota bacterium]
MKGYEALFIIDPDKEASIKEITGAITGSITKAGGKVEKEENWGKQRLAFRIKKKADGVYYKLDFSIEPSNISVLNSNYKLNTDILRVIITTK